MSKEPDRNAYKVTITDIEDGDKYVLLTHKEKIQLGFTVKSDELKEDGGVPCGIDMLINEIPHAYRLGVVDGIKCFQDMIEELQKED